MLARYWHWRLGIQHNDTQHNSIQQSDTHHKGFICDTQHTLYAIMPSVRIYVSLCWMSWRPNTPAYFGRTAVATAKKVVKRRRQDSSRRKTAPTRTMTTTGRPTPTTSTTCRKSSSDGEDRETEAEPLSKHCSSAQVNFYGAAPKMFKAVFLSPKRLLQPKVAALFYRRYLQMFIIS